jgi:hypothetical protein
MKYRQAIVFASSAIVFAAHAQVSISSSSQTYSQNFDSLTTATGTGTSAPAWTNNSTLAGWSLFNAAGGDITSYLSGTGSSSSGSFYSFGASGAMDRALGAVASGGAYFGSPASGAVAGYVALALSNNSGAALDSLTLSYAGEEWRNGGNTNAQSIVLQYGFGSSFASVTTWNTAGSAFDFTSPVTGSTAAAVDGNAAGLVTGLGGTLSGLNWANGDTLWIRWQYLNNSGNDHGLAIDNLSVSVAAATPVPEPSQYALLLAGLGAIGLVTRRRSIDRA